MKIYLTNLAKYNEGTLVGKWIDLPCDNLAEQVKEVLGNDEEYFITDYESDFKISEHDSPYRLNDFCEELEKLDNQDIKKVIYLIENIGLSKEEALENYENVTLYENMTLKDVAYEQVDEGLFGEIPDSIANYIDYDAIAIDLCHDSYIEKNGDVYHYN